MSLFAEFYVRSDEFALRSTLDRLPEMVVEIDRVAATEELLTPYFWVSGVDLDEFETAAAEDPSLEDLNRLDTFDEASLYRGNWTRNVEAVVYAYTHVSATILEAKAEGGRWDIRMRFDDREALDDFQMYADRRDVPFELSRLYQIDTAHSGSQYGLTKKQDEALNVAWEMGYFEQPRETTLASVAAEIGITRQSLSQRLRRGQHALVANTLRVVPLSEE